MMQKNISTLGFALMALIQQQARSGYDLRKIFASTPMGHYSSSPGAIYPALQKLEERGLIKGTIKQTQPLRVKKVFKITVKGKDALKAWLNKSLTQDDIIWHMDELMLRFSFMEKHDAKDVTCFLETLVKELKTYVSELNKYYDLSASSMSLHGSLALQSGIESYKAKLKWAKMALNKFK